MLLNYSLLLITSKNPECESIEERKVKSEKVKSRTHSHSGFLEQVAGIEPATSAWEADVLPLNYTCEYSFFIVPNFFGMSRWFFRFFVCVNSRFTYATIVRTKKADPRFCRGLLFWLVPVAGLEPARYRYRWILSPLRLPIPSHRRIANAQHYTPLFMFLSSSIFDSFKILK